MKILKRPVHQLSLWVGLMACLLATPSCKDTLQLQSEWKQTKARLDVLRARSTELDAKLVDLRKVMPGGTTPLEAGRRMAVRADADLKLLEAETVQATARLRQSEVDLNTLKKEIAAQGS
jgi:hypothetical protein